MTDLDTADETGLSWGERRRRGIGASEVAAVLGRSPWDSPWSVWARKVGLVPVADDPDQDDDNDAARFGRDLEPITAAWFRQRTGLYVAGEQMMLRHPEHPWARATIDGLVFDGEADHDAVEDAFGVDDALGVLELKYTGQPRPADGLPEHHRLQVQWQMFVSGLERAWVATIRTAYNRLAFEVLEVERDDALLVQIVPEVARFWFDHCVTGTPPPVDGSDATTETLKAVFGESAGDAEAVDLDGDLAAAVEHLRQAKAYAKDLADDIALSENQLREALGQAGATEGRVGGFLAVSWRPQRTTRIDTAKARALIGDAADVTTTSRVLRLHQRKA